MRHAVLTLLLVSSALAGCIGAQDGVETASNPDDPATEAAEPVTFTKVHAPEEIAEIVTGYDDRPGVDVTRIGASLEGRPIHLASVGSGPFEVWIVARQHGDEPTGGEAALLTLEALADPDAPLPDDAPQVVETLRDHRETVLDRLTLHVVPVANPDGAAAYQRYTATGMDPNRDHFLFTHPFSDALREAFWERKPDACLDLHNEGVGETDYDAFGPEGPFPEEEPFQAMLRDANLTVREVDAAGGNAGSYNENYRAPVADDQPNPTAFHPGTHDMFCTTRGAPGWTPEGAIEGGSNGATDPIFAWSTRLHQVTVAASALHWAGAYRGTPTEVTKAAGVVGPAIEETVTVEDAAEATFQAVWRGTETEGDHNPTPVRFTVTGPDGTTHEGRTPHPEAWTSTVVLDDPEPGDYTLALQGTPGGGTYELRTYERPPARDLAEVQRTEAGLEVAASADAPRPVEVHVSDVADPAEVAPTSFDPPADEVHVHDGTVDERLVAEWSLTLEPGETASLREPATLDGQSPYRWTAHAGGDLQTGVEMAFNPAPD